MTQNSEQPFLIQHFKRLARLGVLGISLLALGYSAISYFHPISQIAFHTQDILIGTYIFACVLLVLKSVLYRYSSGESLPAVLAMVFGFNALFILFNTVWAHFPSYWNHPFLWALEECTTSLLAFFSLGWFLLQEPKKRILNFRGWLLVSFLVVVLSHLCFGLLLKLYPLFFHSAFFSRTMFAVPLVIWLLTYGLMLRRWHALEASFFTFSVSLGLIPHLLAYALEIAVSTSSPYSPSGMFWILSIFSVLLMFLGLLADFIQLRLRTQKAGDYFKHSQKALVEHTRLIEQANQDLENQIAQQQIQADLNQVLTLSLANLPLKEMLHSMIGYLTDLPWMALTGGWAIYLSNASKENLRVRYTHKLPPEWSDLFPTLNWPQCLCGKTHEQGTVIVCTASFTQLPENPALQFPHYGVALQTTEHEPIGHLVLLATPGSACDAPVQGFLVSVAQILVGVIQRKQAEDELRQERDKINQYINNAGLLFVILNPDGTIQMVNQKAADILGYQTFELLGKNWFTLALPERLQVEVSDLFRNLVDFGQKGMDFYYENPILTRDGVERLVAWHSTVIKNDDDSIQAILASGEDITEQKRLQNQLLQAQKLESIGQLAAGIAHEINTPTQYVGDNIRFMQESFQDLSAVVQQIPAFLQAAKQNTLTPEHLSDLETALKKADIEYLLEELPKAIDQSLDGVTRVSTIVRAMKEFAHPDAGEKTPTDLNHAIESTITISRNEWKYVADIVTDFDPALPLVPLLPGEFNQVILNMLVNASHAIADVLNGQSEQKGTITLRTRLLEAYAEVQISDTGTGIPKEHISKIFDPFFTTKKVGKGTGQGLAISHNVIVEKLKGTIEVKSEVGKGTTFVLRLPLSDI